jgi:hypothetical protein
MENRQRADSTFRQPGRDERGGWPSIPPKERTALSEKWGVAIFVGLGFCPPGHECPGLKDEAPVGLPEGRFSVLLLMSPMVYRRAGERSPQSWPLPEKWRKEAWMGNVVKCCPLDKRDPFPVDFLECNETLVL